MTMGTLITHQTSFKNIAPDFMTAIANSILLNMNKSKRQNTPTIIQAKIAAILIAFLVFS